MKRFLNFFSSSKATMILLFILALAMAVATFIEDKYDTVSARSIVYNTRWFELLFVLLALNLIGHIKTYNLISWKKIGGLIFHLAFILMIIGAGITRYFGFEGNMHIRQGEASKIVYSADPYLMISYTDNKQNYNYDHPIRIGLITDNSFHISIPTDDKGNIDIKFKEFISNAVEKIEENVAGGKNMIELSVLTSSGLQNVFINEGEVKNLGLIKISYNNSSDNDAVKLDEKEGKLYISSPYDIRQATMDESVVDTLMKDSLSIFQEKKIYSTNGLSFVCNKFYKSALKKIVSGVSTNMESNGNDAIVLEVAINGKKHEAIVMYNASYSSGYNDYSFDGTNIKIGFGSKTIELPFALYLKNFIFEKYPGSERPSSYKSEVTLIDDKNNVKEDYSIFMNNVLDYKQYRFFQSSYDTDERGTILSVNHDYWGTFVSYLGYTLLTIGFIITLFNKNSRFLSLRKFITDARNKRKSILLCIIFLLGFNGIGFSQNNSANIIDAFHADKFGHLLTQTYDGRFAPVHTLAIDLMHKIAKKDNFNIEGKGKMNAMQAFIDMMAEPQFWQQQKIIYVPQKAIRDIIGINTEYASFLDFFDANQQYKMDKYINDAFRKKQSEKNKVDKEILKVDERLNIFSMIINGSILKIFPEQNSKNNKWISWDDNSSMIPLTGAISIINNDLQLKTFNYANIMHAYIFEVQKGISTSDYSKADKIVGYISDIQKQISDPSLLPSDTKRNAEIFYNNADIFIFLKNVYALFSVLLLVLAFIENVKTQKSKFIGYTLNILTILLVIAFLYHTLGMGLRWYITEHAPWSNGYEALILVAWGALLAGFSFAKNSKLTLAATTLLAFFVLMTASHSSYDPQLTNLQPVLKSYWLIIHVATLTISYGFLGLGFILGLMNLFIYLSKTKSNSTRLDLLITENTYIIEMNLIIGLFLATLGTFLGAVWANESWGKYWGWDAKETWALVIVVTYSIIIHMRFIPKFNTKFAFNVASVLGFSSVIMTFVGVNYYLSKGMHSYGAGDTPVFPLWAWGTIIAIIILIISAGIKERNNKLN
ncbi:MAG: cytochrome c biogenesis protein CcsA [Bacteroidetes bacterium]|nr:cytochrome c biogenesis protein CcsA [Bacteroidota bacterium]